MTLLRRPEREVWHTPIGYLLDQIALYVEHQSGEDAEPAQAFIDEIMPPDI